mmetsp:Transcript_8833/g.12563  ORF Transcript_8833/g.12563 Transcript_8833/m.12563 type:complete len:327 (-) Transcript_8833:194-1174(-)|eukprot:CAMPEP_0184856292 /NCGR_PEP_ID=MMETSP0580-20130426/1491_1 /TAXON_ID=1118495 /ORGANISM="Dactyliosolen fragilissimus" /LENGTH=326 /DNA_ID=CAMNT_0027351253 /DNA_START=97 /DNA_END=1077 /DNA_ORIENTATION=+
MQALRDLVSCRYCYTPKQKDAIGPITPQKFTLTPSSSPSNVPPCITDDLGNFGSTASESDENTPDIFSSVVPYFYEVETSGDAPEVSSFLKSIEKGIADEVLSTAFEGCPSTSVARMRLLQEATTEDVVNDLVGFSSSPTDVVDTSVECLSKPSRGGKCTFIEGRLSLYTKSEPDEGNTLILHKLALDTIKLTMEANTLSGDIEGVTDVRYRESRPSAQPAAAGSAITTLDDDGGSNLWLMAPAFLSAFAVGALLYRRHRKKNARYNDLDAYHVDKGQADDETVTSQDTSVYSGTGSAYDFSWFPVGNRKSELRANFDEDGNLEVL